MGWDGRVERSVHDFVSQHDWLADLARALTHLGDPIVVTVATLVLAAILLGVGRRRAALSALVIRAVAIVADTALKHAVGRARPVFTHPIATAGGPAFPSGHAFGSAALCGTLAMLATRRWWLRLAIAVPVPVIVAATRVLLGVHYLSDVVAGLLLGWGVAVIGVAAVGAGEPASPRLAPSAKVNDT